MGDAPFFDRALITAKAACINVLDFEQRVIKGISPVDFWSSDDAPATDQRAGDPRPSNTE